MATTAREISERFSQILEMVNGDPKYSIIGISTPQSALANQIIFIADQRHLEAAYTSKSRVWVVKASILNQIKEAPSGLTLFKAKDSQLAMAVIGRDFFRQKVNKFDFETQGVHPSAVVHARAQLATDVIVGPNSTIGADVVLAEGVRIGANTTIEAGAQIGQRTRIHSQVYIAPSVIVGEDCEIHPQTSIGTEGFGYAWDEKGQHHRLTHFGKVIIEDRVHIGAGVQIDRGTIEDSVVGAGTVIDNHCHFGHNIKIGKGNIITAGMITAGSVTIGDRCVFGGRSIIAGHTKIASGSQFAGLSAIHSSVEKPGQYGGYPLQSLKAALKTTASLAALPRLRKNVSKIMKHLGLEEEESLP